MSEITSLSATELALLIRERQVSPVEVMDAYLQRIEELNPALNAFACVDAERARAQAHEAERSLMQGDSKPLLGVPVTIKSCIDVEGLPCEAGSRLRAGYVAAQDAPLVKRLKDAGAIVIGNTTVPEMLLAYHTENALTGRANSPWDLARTPGGSSGGEAAAIAACMSAGGIGSDGGGSIRVPAHFSGICGLKPTPGRIPGTGHYPPCAGPFSIIGVVGPMARTISDLQLLFEATAGYDHGDPCSVPLPVQPIYKPIYKGEVQKLRIGYFDDDGYSPPTPETKDAIRAAADALRSAGFEVSPFRPQRLERVRELWEAIFVDGIAMVTAPAVKGHEDEISSNTREFLALAAARPPFTAERLMNTLLERDQVRQQFLAQMEDFPIMLSPVCSIPAFHHEDAGWGPQHAADYLRTMSYCQYYNLLGNPAAVVPVGKSHEGLPIGVQVIGRPFREEEVLSVAAVIDEQFGWREPKPYR
ncbi:MAG: amidase [Candidatus Angelobacter sp. Gp1-AA117]|nr:MAG: amidase [Candidatus Angelobacter sp. Gp1-AA117]